MHHRFERRLIQPVLLQSAILVDVHPLAVGAITSLSFGFMHVNVPDIYVRVWYSSATVSEKHVWAQ